MKNIRLLLLVACFIIYLHTAAQPFRGSGFALDRCLKPVQSADSNTLIKQKIDDIRAMRQQATLAGIVLNDKWNLVFYESFGWRESFPRDRHYYQSRFVGHCPDSAYTTAALLDTFGLNRRVIDSAMVLRFFPVVLEREDPLNRGWSLIAMGSEELIIRYIHSYPNGNQTSWYTEIVYYFKRKK